MFTNDIFFWYSAEDSLVTVPLEPSQDMRAILLEMAPYNEDTLSTVPVRFSSGRRTSSVNGASGPYYVRLRESFTYFQLVFPDNIPADRQISIGTISVNNTDGALDDLLDHDWGGRSVIMKRGYATSDYSEFQTFFTGGTTELSATRNDLVFTLRDNSYRLQIPLQNNKFTGGGGREGPLELRQRAKPLLFGSALNMTPVMLDEVLQVYQVNDGPIQVITDVFDRAVPLTPTIDFATYELLIAASIPNGSYATCLAEGMFRLGAPAESITVDGVGQFGSETTMSGIVRAILASRGILSSDLNLSTWTEFASDFPYSISGMYYQDPALEVSEWLQNILGSSFGFFFFDNSGKLCARQFKFRSPVGLIRAEAIVSLSRDISPKPVHRVFVDYSRNLTVNQIGEFTLGFQDLIVYLKDDRVFIATASDGSGGTYSYVGQVYAFIETVDVSDTGAVEFRKVTPASWLTLSPDGSFTVSNPGVDVATCTIRVSARNIYRDVTFNLVKSKGASPANLVLTSTNRLFVYDSLGQPDPSGQTSVITATPTNVTLPLTFTAIDNLGDPVTLTGTGNVRTLSIANVSNSQQVSFIVVTASSTTGEVFNSHRIGVYNRSSGSGISIPGSPGEPLRDLRVAVDQAVVKFNAVGVMTPSSQTPIFSASVQNILGVGVWTFQDNLGTSSSTLAGFFTFPTGTTAQAGISLWTNPSRIQVKATFTLGSYSDTENLLRVDDGSGGLLGYLTNNAHGVPSSSSGVVSSFVGAEGNFRVFFNGDEVTTDSACVFSILVNADSLVATIDGDGFYEVTGAGSWPNISDGALLTLRATYTPPGGSALTVEQVFSLTKARAGANGTGLSTASIFLFQRTSANVAPTVPSVTTTYTFATGILSGTFSPWTQDLPATGGQYIWITLATATADIATDSILASEWATPALYGLPGVAGNSSAVVFIYQRATSTPAAPSATTTYTFATGDLTGLDGGWSISVPTVNGDPLWVRTATAFGNTTDTIASGEWTTSRKMSEDGTNGDDGNDGLDGIDGNQVEFIWRRSATIPATPSGDGIPAGWSDDPMAGSDPLWMSKAKQNFVGDLLPGESWSIPVRHDGPPGLDGIPGDDGTTFYEWIAYANSPNGTVDFTTGSPGTRAFIGRSSGNVTSTESTSPLDYQWSQYKGPPGFGLVSRGTAILASELYITGDPGGWGSSGVFSSESFTNGASVSFAAEGTAIVMVGLNSDPATDDSFTSLDYAFYLSNSLVQIYESGSLVTTVSTSGAETARGSITYDNKKIKYYLNGSVVREIDVSPNRTFWLDTAGSSGRVRLTGWGPVGSSGNDGDPGNDGADGADAFVVTSNLSALVVACDSGKVPVSGALPQTVTFRAKLGSTDVSVSTSWPNAVSTNCVVTNLGGGQYRLDSVGADQGLFTVLANYSGRTQQIGVTYSKTPAGDSSVTIRDTSITQATSSSFVTVSDTFVLPFNSGQILTFSVSGVYNISGAPSDGSQGLIIARFMYRNLTDGGAWTQAGSNITGSYAVADYIVFPSEPEHIPGTIAGSYNGLISPTSLKAYEVNLQLSRDGVAVFQEITFTASVQ